MKKLSGSIQPFQVLRLLLSLVVFEGLIAVAIYFSSPSESKNAFLWGFSLQRLAIGIISILFLLIFIGALVLSFTVREKVELWLAKLINGLGSPVLQIVILAPLAWLLTLLLGLNLAYAAPFLLRLVPFITSSLSLLQQSRIVQIWTFMIPVQLWAALILLQAFLFCLVLSRRQKPAQAVLSAPVWLAVFGWTTTMTFLGLSVVWGGIAGHLLSLLVTGPTAKLLLLSVWFSLWAALQAKYPERASHYINYFISASIWLVTFILACQLAQWMDSLVTPVMNYWNILADAFLHGRAYLIDPVKTFDMTFYNGQWYIPLPPLPAFLLAPFVALWGVAAINTTIFSLALSSTTAVLLFLTLAELSSRHWIELSRAGMVWLVLLFSFGSVQLWLSISSQVWYFSQVSTILFVALAFYFAVKRRPAWLTGLALALAVTGRPNGFVLWPALLCITLQIQIESDQGFSWKRLIAWAAGSSIPVVVAVGFLLYYNDIRFGNYLDFGYATVNGASWVVRNVQQYGMFNLHFVSNNLQTGFLAPPDLKASCDYYVPRGNGLSMFAATPAFIYVLRKFKFSWWSLGCWVSMLLSVALLLMYHNNGSVQISYRYVMDFMIPIILVIAFTAGQRISLPLKVLIVLSFLINYYAIISWVHGPC